MATLGDILGQENKATIIASAIEVGHVFRMKLSPEEGITPKSGDDDRNKYFVVVGISADYVFGVVLINTEINKNLSPLLKDLHYPVSVTKYPFLKQNRFVDCGSIKEIVRMKFSLMFEAPKDKFAEEDMELIKKTLVNDAPIEKKKLLKFNLIK